MNQEITQELFGEKLQRRLRRQGWTSEYLERLGEIDTLLQMVQILSRPKALRSEPFRAQANKTFQLDYDGRRILGYLLQLGVNPNRLLKGNYLAHLLDILLHRRIVLSTDPLTPPGLAVVDHWKHPSVIWDPDGEMIKTLSYKELCALAKGSYDQVSIHPANVLLSGLWHSRNNDGGLWPMNANALDHLVDNQLVPASWKEFDGPIVFPGTTYATQWMCDRCRATRSRPGPLDWHARAIVWGGYFGWQKIVVYLGNHCDLGDNPQFVVGMKS